MQKSLFATCLLLFILTSVFSQTVSFTLGTLSGESLTGPTSLQFGPDGRLYVSQQNGLILAYTIVRNGANNYQVTATESITLVQQIPNHNDDGTLSPTTNTRQVTGIVVAGTAANPILYVTSSDPRIGGGAGSTNKNLDTNSGIISKLTKTNGVWTKQDLVRGLPRSEENHSPNGLFYDAVNNFLYMAQGGNTNMGAPSNNFVNLPEYAYSTAILKVDLNAIGASTYDLPTLDDETRANVSGAAGYIDPNDPFGGNDGKNQGLLVSGGPVTIYSSGWRNNYDIIITKAGKMYSSDNGPNAGWGGPPTNCSNAVSEPGTADCDVLHYVTQGYFAGHPNPTRANRSNTFNTSNPQTPIPLGMENPLECSYSTPSVRPGAITTNCTSSNGLCEYTASNFNNAMKGDLLLASFNGKLYRIKFDGTGTALAAGGKTSLASNFGATPLDVTAQGDNDIFPGSIWICTYGSSDITILEPADFINCSGDLTSHVLDFDADGYSNGDESDNQTEPCSAASKPHDYDNDHLSDLNDPDDDNDGISDLLDRFPVDAFNGFNTTIPVNYEFDNSTDGGLLDWGFTGVMTNGGTDYANLFDADAMTVGGAALKFTIEQVPAGDALDNLNNQLYGFQFGVNVGASQWSYIIHSRVMGPFAGFTPADNQSMGMFIGTGDQDNYMKIVTAADNGNGGIQVLKEENGVSSVTMFDVPIQNTSYVDLFLYVNKNTHEVQPKYSLDGGAEISIGSALAVPSNWLSGVLAVGFISTSRSSGQVFPATWDFIEVKYDPTSVIGQWYPVNSLNSPTARQECTYVQAGNKFYLLGGRGSRPVQSYNPIDSLWTTEASNPIEMHHFQAVQYNGLIYAVCAFTGSYPHETPLSNIYIYDPAGKQWSMGPVIPESRRRGSAGCVVYDNKIYVVCGIIDGHVSGWVPWLDVFDPQTNTWTQLPDAPHERDHFFAAVAEGKIYCIGGRRSGFDGNTFKYTVSEVDVYDIALQTWTTLPASANIPTPRAACPTAVLGNEILAIGGESDDQATAHNETEALNIHSNTWRTLSPLLTGRHGTGAIVSNGGVYICAGSGNKGGSPELSTQEVFYFFDPTPPTGTQIIKGNLLPDAAMRYFGLVNLGSSFTKTLTLTNSAGNQVIMIDSLTLNDTTNFKINFPSSLPFLLGVNQSTTLSITCHPASTGIKNAALKIKHTGINSPLSIQLQGEGTNLSCTNNCVFKSYFPDADGDTYGYPKDSVVSALPPTGYVLNKTDCNDANSTVSPAAAEIFDNIDNNCNGAVDEGFGAPNVLFVVGNTILGTSDAAIKARMDALGFDVTAISDAAVQTSSATGQDFIFISSTITSGNIGTKFTNTAIPLINCEPSLFDDLKMTSTSTSDFGNLTNQTQLNISNASHPLAAGLSAGASTVFTSTDRFVYGVPSASAAKVAMIVASSTQAVIFGYEAGASMVGMNAPARRAGFFLYDTGAGKLTSSGIALLDAALLWMVNSNTPPQVSITSPANGAIYSAPANVTISVNASSATSTITKVELYQNNSLVATDNSSPYSFSLSNLVVGSYSFYVKAYDLLGLTANSTAITITVQSASAPNQVLFVVGNTTLNNGDLAIKTRLEALGFSATVKADASSATTDATGKSLVFVSSTVSSTSVGSKFKSVTVPVIVCENAILDDMEMTDDPGGNFGTSATTNKISITNNAHALAAGLPLGDQVVYSSNDKLTWGKPGSSAIVIANVPGATTQIALFGYETGSVMFGINAPGRRVGLFLTDASAAMLTTAGSQLLNAAILWAAPAATPDCNGVQNGSALINDCGICVGGNTGLPASQGKDCNGVCNGTALPDGCGICSGGNTGHVANSNKDCNGVCNGTAIVNGCGICTGGNTGIPVNQGTDCNGVCNGTAFLDDCGVCSGGNTGYVANSNKDCNGVCNGVAKINSCGICVGGNTGIPINQGTDCNGVCNGTAFLDDCGICSGGNTGHTANSNKDCNGVCNGTAVIDGCGICSGGNTGHVANSNKDVCGVCFGNGSSCATPCVPNEVVSFTLMHTGTAGEIGPLTNGTIINLATIGPFSIRANTCNGQNVGSVKFIVNGATVRTETYAPYAINGDEPTGSYNAWSVNVGSYTLIGKPYTAASGAGTAGVSETVTFSVINQLSTVPDCNNVVGGTAFYNSCGICVGGNTGLGANTGKDCNDVCNGTAFLDDCAVCSGGNTGHTANSNKDACGVCFGNGTSCAPCQPLQVTSFTLVHEGTAGDIGPLNTGATIYLASIGNFSIRANICPGSTSVKSVKFILNGTAVKTESAAPFAINGDTPTGSYTKWNPAPGSYMLKVTPYSSTGGTGTAGVALTVNFTVVSGSAPKTELADISSGIQKSPFRVYPNPNNGQFMLELETDEACDIHVNIFNHLGQTIYTDVKRNYAGELTEQIQLNTQPKGMYFMQVISGERIFMEKIIVR